MSTFPNMAQPVHWSVLSAILDPSKIQFSKSKLSDPHIQKILQYVSQASGGKMKDIEAYITAEMAKFQINYKKAPLLYGTILENFVENEAFNLFQRTEQGIVTTAPKFSLRVFNNLRARIQAEHSYMFPLKNKIDRLALKSEKYVFVPTTQKEDMQFNDIDTAAATPTGTFIFSVPFCQKLLEFGHVKGLQPPGLKYTDGSFAPEWAYIEFLLLHEYMHYTQADWHYQKLYKASGVLSNYAGDFRSNYELVKGGLPQLPLGLFSRDINYDAQRDMGEIIAVVKSEMDKLNDKDQEQVKKRMNQNADEHDRKDANGDASSSGDSSESEEDANANNPTQAEMDAHSKDISEKAATALSESTTKESKPDKGDEKSEGNGGTGKGGKSAEPRAQFDYKSVTPDFSWDQLLRKFVKSSSGGTEDTFTKMSRRSITSIDMASKLGSAPVKPGEVEKFSKLKLVVVVDNSYSMSEALPKVNANLAALLKGGNQDLGRTFFMIRFSDTFKVYYCNVNSKDGIECDPATLKPIKDIKRTKLDWLFSTAESGGTEFTGALKKVIETFIQQKYSVLIATDTDVIYGNNFIQYGDLVRKNLKSVYTILDTSTSYKYAVQKFGMSPPNLTFFK